MRRGRYLMRFEPRKIDKPTITSVHKRADDPPFPKPHPMDEAGHDISAEEYSRNPTAPQPTRNGRITEKDVQMFVSSCRMNTELAKENKRKESEFMRRLGGGDIGSTRVMKKLFQLWAHDYDEHMIQTGHERAVENLLRQAIELNRMNFGNYDIPIIGRRLLNLSCGTGR